MLSKLLLILFMLPWLQNCSKPQGTIFEDNRLAREEKIKVCLLGDLGQDTPHQKKIASALKKENCHRLFFLGDLVYPNGIESSHDPILKKKFLDYYSQLFTKDTQTVINLLLGNHDHQGNIEAWLDLGKTNPHYFFPYYYYMVDYGGLCFVALDTDFYIYKKNLVESGEQILWLQNLKDRLKSCSVKVALTHHPYKGGGHSGSKDWTGAEGALKLFFNSFIIGKFNFAVAGHTHLLADEGEEKGTRLLISGTGSENRGNGPSGYLVMEWEKEKPEKLNYHFKHVDVPKGGQ